MLNLKEGIPIHYESPGHDASSMPRVFPGQGFPGGQIGTRIGCDFQQVAGHRKKSRGWDSNGMGRGIILWKVLMIHDLCVFVRRPT